MQLINLWETLCKVYELYQYTIEKSDIILFYEFHLPDPSNVHFCDFYQLFLNLLIVYPSWLSAERVWRRKTRNCQENSNFNARQVENEASKVNYQRYWGCSEIRGIKCIAANIQKSSCPDCNQYRYQYLNSHINFHQIRCIFASIISLNPNWKHFSSFFAFSTII